MHYGRWRLCLLGWSCAMLLAGCGDDPPTDSSPTPPLSGPTPTGAPTLAPTDFPTDSPTDAPTGTPAPTGSPTSTPGPEPSSEPTAGPTATPAPTGTPPAPTPTPGPTPPIDQDGDGVTLEDGDCNDADQTVYPGADELPYDGIDQDCDGADLTDVDGDGQDATEAGGADCEDADPDSYTGALEVPYDGIDQDCDGHDLLDADYDSYNGYEAFGPDCDDRDATVYPGAVEYVDGKDNDCDDQIDEDPDPIDHDGDGYSAATGDCDDTRAGVHPGASEVPYDGVDQDCTGGDLIDVDGDGYVSTTVSGGTDCQDGALEVHPGADEVPYDDIDQDCSGADLTDLDGDGYPSTAVAGGTDCDDSSSAVHPGASETCDNRDNNCDGVTDLDAVDRPTWYTDEDGDTYGDPSAPVLACQASGSLVADHTDCDDTRQAVHPGALETCNGIDDDCDSSVDEGVLTTYYRDADADGYGNGASTAQGCAAPAGYVSNSLDCDDSSAAIHPGTPETANGLDDDCNGQIDEGVLFSSCSSIKKALPASVDGVYSIDPDGSGSVVAYDVYCDMTTDGGGWTLVLNLDTSDGHVMWWADPLWSDANTRGSVPSLVKGDYKGAAWNSYSGSTKVLVVVHEQGTYRGWKSFTKVDGKTMYQYLQGGDNTLLGKAVLNSSVANLSSKERLVRLSSALYANHCRDIYGTGCTTTGVSYGPDGDRLGSHEGTPADNTGGGLGNWHDIGACCGSNTYAGKACYSGTFRTASEAQGGWSTCYGTGGEGTFGSDSFMPPSNTCNNGSCSSANWAAFNGVNYDYAVFLAGP